MAFAHDLSDRINAPPGGRPLRVLVVEDDPDCSASTALLLGLYGHEVQTVADGPAALGRVQTFRPDVVLLDIGLPGMDGWEVTRQLREQEGTKRPLLIAVTAFKTPADRQRSHRTGVDLHLNKPVDPEYLRELMERLRLALG